jgi:hypothetical protein
LKVILIFLLAGHLPLPGLSQLAAAEGKNVRRRAASVSGPSRRRPLPAQFACLPEGFTPADVVSYTRKHKDKEGFLTLQDKLVELKARCKSGKLVDGKGREIRFFRVTCYGNPPENYEELMQKEREELEALQKHFTVIVLACDPRIG